jgi:hypothetical protein
MRVDGSWSIRPWSLAGQYPQAPHTLTITYHLTTHAVTGDNIHTARHIARECGILPDGSNYTCIEGPAFRKLSEAELKEMLPNMRVGGPYETCC